ncbi:hypothetical protein JCM10369A_28690 [Nocardioides pyridinolyticus]
MGCGPVKSPRRHGAREADLLETALAILDAQGLPGITMRRLAAPLGVQQSALYCHLASKQLLLAAMAEKILRRGPEPSASADWDTVVSARGGAARHPARLPRRRRAGVDGVRLRPRCRGAAPPSRRGVHLRPRDQGRGPGGGHGNWQFVLGFTFGESQHLHASSPGGIDGLLVADPSTGRTDEPDPFAAGIALILDGIRARLARTL